MHSEIVDENIMEISGATTCYYLNVRQNLLCPVYNNTGLMYTQNILLLLKHIDGREVNISKFMLKSPYE